ncbi:MAG: HAD domain-containing protein [bacterium]
MKILFLDMDGVCNSKQHFMMIKHIEVPPAETLSDADLFMMKLTTNANNMWVLKYILEQVPDLKIVISSAWRLHYQMDSFTELFKIYGLPTDRIIDKTPKKFSSERVHEIHMWLDDYKENHGHEVDWIALDDHVIFNLEDPDKKREFLTEPWAGVTMKDAFAIIKHFKPQYHQPFYEI